MWSKNQILQSFFIGKNKVPLTDCTQHGRDSRWVSLFPKTGVFVCGEVELELSWISQGSPSSRLPSHHAAVEAHRPAQPPPTMTFQPRPPSVPVPVPAAAHMVPPCVDPFGELPLWQSQSLHVPVATTSSTNTQPAPVVAIAPSVQQGQRWPAGGYQPAPPAHPAPTLSAFGAPPLLPLPPTPTPSSHAPPMHVRLPSLQ